MDSLRSIRKLDAVLLAKTNSVGGHCMGENNRTFENRNCMQAQFLFVDRALEQVMLGWLHWDTGCFVIRVFGIGGQK